METVRIGPDGVAAEAPGLGRVLMATSVPAAGREGFSHGCLLVNTGGTTTGDALYINTGSKTSCNFQAVNLAAAISADSISESTPGSGVTVDGVLIKDEKIYVANIEETTEGEGVVIDGLKIRSGKATASQGTPEAETSTSQSYSAGKIYTTGLITSTQTSAVSAALDSGTAMSSALTGDGALPQGHAFQWNLINLGTSSGAVTLQPAAGHTIVGNPVVAISTSAAFKTRLVSSNTWITYRIS